ncbi:hypothetical protein OAZ13_00185 [Gammaproteobacteria bacterium]|nr:hypothetical protein [Gammaproteobacteria bacterium]
MKSNTKFLKRIKTKAIYKDCFSKHSISQYGQSYSDAKNFFIYFWSIFENYSLSKSLNNQVPGDAFEIIFAFILDYENIEIFSMDEQVKGIDFVKPDFITKKHHHFISCKTSLRERWKQADWESMRFKKIYSKSKCFLLTNHYKEYLSLKNKITKLDLDEVYFAGSDDINLLIKQLR